MLDATSKCPHCGAAMRLAEAHARVPHISRGSVRERSEYRCKGCGGFAVLRLGRLGYALYAALLPALVAAWEYGVKRAVVVTVGLVACGVIYRGGVSLRATHPPSGRT